MHIVKTTLLISKPDIMQMVGFILLKYFHLSNGKVQDILYVKYSTSLNYYIVLTEDCLKFIIMEILCSAIKPVKK